MATPVSADRQLELALALLEDNEDVLEEVLRELGPPVFAALRQRFEGVLRAEDIEDVVSIALHRVWESRHQYDDRKASLKTWFYRIALNAARDVLRHGWQKARQLECDLGEDFDLDEVAHPSTEEVPKGGQKAKKAESKLERDLRETLEELPDVQRKIVMADAHAKDRVASSEWLAAELGIPVGTVRVYRKRAMDRIRAELRQRGHHVP